MSVATHKPRRNSPHSPILLRHRHGGDEHLIEMLTPREMEVLQLIALGHSTDMIAGTTGIAVKSVRDHVNRMLQKLGARNRMHAVHIGYRVGLLRAPGVDGTHTVQSALRLAAYYSALALRLMESEGGDE